MNWETIVSRVAPSVVRIDTPEGTGTGFLCLNDENRKCIAIGTAAHVIDRADQWQQPIRITTSTAIQRAKGPVADEDPGTAFVTPDKRIIGSCMEMDSAVLLIPPLLDFIKGPDATLLPEPKTLPVGTAIGWLGFPDTNLCFFTGTISAVIDGGYLVNGTAICGVSGGPAFYFDRTANKTYIIGIVTSYRQHGEPIPSLSVVRDLSHVHSILKSYTGDAERTHQEFDRLVRSLH